MSAIGYLARWTTLEEPGQSPRTQNREHIVKQIYAGLVVLGTTALAAAVIARADTAASPSPTQIVLARQAALDMSAVTFVTMKHAAESGDVSKMADPAGALAAWSKVLPMLFPAGTGVGLVSVPTKAKAEIWSNHAAFEQRAADYAAAAAKLPQLVKAGDTAGFSAQLDVVKKACSACHQDFQQR
jgi:cytochrome c556